jgi:hypothetical protein
MTYFDVNIFVFFFVHAVQLWIINVHLKLSLGDFYLHKLVNVQCYRGHKSHETY